MRIIQTIVVLALLGVALPALAQEQNKYALLIGIDDYTSPSLIKKELKYAKADALSLEEALEDRDWDTVALVDAAADRGRIIRELYKLSLKAGPSDKVLIYFAGHGVRDPRGKGNTYWVTTDATVENLVSDGIRLNHILEYVNEIGAQEKMVILDHCYSGDFDAGPGDGGTNSRDVGEEATVRINERDLYPEEVKSLEDYKQPRLVIMAAARGPAYEDDAWGHGMFTKAILDTLNDPESDDDPQDGKISLDELWDYLKDSIDEMANEKGLEQRPLSNASINQLDWQLFDAAVEDVSEEASELRNLLTNIELGAGGSLDFEVKKACIDAINDWEAAAEGGYPPETVSEEIVRILRSIRDLGVSAESMQMLVQRVNEVRQPGGSS
ncbi:MAG: caspase family protein [Gammaproteobacteria bacterium]